MGISKHFLAVIAAALLAWPTMNQAAFAERGDRGGNRGDQGGQSGGDGGHALSNASSPGGDNRSGDGGKTFRAGDGQSSAGSSRGNRGDRMQGQPQQSFFRGPDNEKSSHQRDRDQQSARQGSNDRDRDRQFDNRNDNRSDRDRGDFVRYGRNDWRYDLSRNWWQGKNRNDLPFRSGWWDSYAGAGWPIYSPFRYSRWADRPYFWWGYTPAGRLTDWLVFGWDRPRYWAYGPGANIYYQDGYVYYDNRRTIGVNDYYQEIYDLAHSVPQISQADAERMDWTPLGVFAVGQNNQAESQRALQLAVAKNGIISGTYFNRQTGGVHPVSGMVEQRTQRAAWAFADGKEQALVFETALYNLTRDQSTMMVHYGPNEGDTQVWQLVRLQEPDAAATPLPQPQNSARTLP